MDTLDRMPFKAQKAVFDKLLAVADVANLSKEERIQYDEALSLSNRPQHENNATSSGSHHASHRPYRIGDTGTIITIHLYIAGDLYQVVCFIFPSTVSILTTSV